MNAAAAGASPHNSISWFAAHEGRLIWRDFASLITGGKPRRIVLVGLIVLAFAAGMHWFAAHLVRPALDAGILADQPTLLMISGGLAMFFFFMFSQAIESVTRAYYARSDLDLILSSPAPSHRLFQVRTSVLTLQTIGLSLLIASPLLNVLVFMDGWRWLGAYAVLIAMGGFATALAVVMTLLLFRLVGTARTRLIAQIIAAVVGAGFVIALQAVAILFGQGFSRFALFSSTESASSAPDLSNWVWVPARAAMGEGGPVLVVALICTAFLIGVIAVSARRFARDVLATSGLVERKQQTRAFGGFSRKSSLRSVLRRKEWMLLKRDPWLMSQSLQQILYLVPPALLLWVNYGGSDGGAFYVVIAVVVMAAGQLAGGLSWLTISGEDAHELIDTAPIAPRTILRAKAEAVFVIIALVLSPFVLALAVFSPRMALCLIGGAFMASASAVMIQLMFRSQANRSLFRRRQVSSKAATICEALVSILWAAAAAAVALKGLLIVVPFFVIFAIIMGFAWMMRPRRAA